MKKMDELVFRITGISLQEEFDTMSQSGSDVRFARALQHTANFLILQRVAAKSIKHPLTQTQNDTIILVSRLLGDHTITDFSEAANILVHVSASLLGVVDTSRT